ncbi:MAG TPA: hypothetical protein HPP87_01390 [Planctomycetes bacterium]|nr:hypothetical protein [Planctomycetota bacterium]HIJ69998.1 hypothetical protein [Planctomycetota bacterium]
MKNLVRIIVIPAKLVPAKECCPCGGMSPLRRQGQGAGIHDLWCENGFQIKPALSKAEWVWNDSSRTVEILRSAYSDVSGYAGLRRPRDDNSQSSSNLTTAGG